MSSAADPQPTNRPLIVDTERPLIDEWTVLVPQDAIDADDVQSLRDSLGSPENDVDFEVVRRELGL